MGKRPAPIEKPAALSLTVQFAGRSNGPSRAQVRRWVAATLRTFAFTEPLVFVVRFVHRAEARGLNLAFRQRDYATNVLTFPYDPHHNGAPTGADIVICDGVVAEEARAQGKPLMHHYAHLVVHGILHAIGLDHEDDASAQIMERCERDVLAGFGIADPYDAAM